MSHVGRDFLISSRKDVARSNGGSNNCSTDPAAAAVMTVDLIRGRGLIGANLPAN